MVTNLEIFDQYSPESWIHKLVIEYNKVEAYKADEANKIITDCLDKLEKLNRRA